MRRFKLIGNKDPWKLAAVTLVAAVSLLWIWSSTLAVGAPYQFIEPTTILDVASNDPEFLLTRLTSTSVGLVALGETPKGASQILRFDLQGIETSRSSGLPGTSPSGSLVRGLTSDGEGDVAVMVKSSSSRDLKIFDQSNRVTKTIHVDSPVQDLALVPTDAFGLIGTAIVRLSDNSTIASLPANQEYKLVSVAPSTLVAVSSISPTMYTVDVTTGNTIPHNLSCPALQRALQLQQTLTQSPTPTLVTPLLIYAVASDQSGLIYGTVSPSPQDRAVVIVFNSSGDVLRSLTLHLPTASTIRRSSRTFTNLPVTTNLSATLTGVSPDGQQLFLYSQAHNKIAVYNISQ